jgi:hypothetical protein
MAEAKSADGNWDSISLGGGRSIASLFRQAVYFTPYGFA